MKDNLLTCWLMPQVKTMRRKLLCTGSSSCGGKINVRPSLNSTYFPGGGKQKLGQPDMEQLYQYQLNMFQHDIHEKVAHLRGPVPLPRRGLPPLFLHGPLLRASPFIEMYSTGPSAGKRPASKQYGRTAD